MCSVLDHGVCHCKPLWVHINIKHIIKRHEEALMAKICHSNQSTLSSVIGKILYCEIKVTSQLIQEVFFPEWLAGEHTYW